MKSVQPEGTAPAENKFDWQNPGIDILPKTMPVTHENLRSYFPDGTVVLCDIYLQGVETGQRIPGGFYQDGIINIDHHSPADEMAQPISSAPLAIEYVRAHGPIGPEIPVVTNHLDTDSVLSTAIMRGILQPNEIFAAAAVAADHTGEPNDIADLLQSIQRLAEAEHDISFSLYNLGQLLIGAELSTEVKQAISQRYADRENIKRAIENGETGRVGSVTYLVTNEKIDSGLVPALLPEAAAIIISNPIRDIDNGKVTGWNNSVRLGRVRLTELNLHKLELNSFDRNFGGRWNAGSNKRGGGTQIYPREYAELLNGKIQNYPKT